MKKWYLVLAATVMLCGCAHAPAEKAKEPAAENRLSAAYINETIVKGKTTDKEILQKIGAPNSVEGRDKAVTTGPAKIWNFWTVPPIQALQRGRYPITRMWVSFDDNGVVLDFKVTDSSLAVP